MSLSPPSEPARALAARAWRYRLGSELQAAQRFAVLSSQLGAAGASKAVVGLAHESAEDELRHAELCRRLVLHFGGTVGTEPKVTARRVAPACLKGRDSLLYEVVALSCVTETLSTALLGELVDRARDSLARQAMHTILRDEIKHSRLGWAFLAEQQSLGSGDCIGEHLSSMLSATFDADIFADKPSDPRAAELAGLGVLERDDRQRIVRETLELVVFPGLERFGIDTQEGKAWVFERVKPVAKATALRS